MVKSNFLGKVLTRIERLDRQNVENYLLRLAQEKGLLESIFNSMLEGILVTDREQKVIFMNHAAETLLAVSEKELLHQSLRSYLESLDLGELAQLIEKDWGKLIHRDIQIDRPEPKLLHLNAFPLVSSDNEYLGLVLILTDVTKIKEEERDQMRAEKLQTVNLMAACIAHEIGNPLSAIDIHLQLMERELKKNQKVKSENLSENLQVIKKEIRRLDQTLRGFLVAARPMRPNLQGTHLDRLIQETVSLVKEEFSINKITIKLDLSEHLPKVMLDEHQMKQAIYNIIKNAFEAMPHGGILKISAYEKNHHVKMEFQDNGEGIGKEKLSRIFEPYYTTKTTGSGLGLMIAYRIVKEHGGRIEVSSKEGKGTTFVMSLPLESKRKINLLPEKTRLRDE
jgi:two-component system, sporulation sensor kinase E